MPQLGCRRIDQDTLGRESIGNPLIINAIRSAGPPWRYMDTTGVAIIGLVTNIPPEPIDGSCRTGDDTDAASPATGNVTGGRPVGHHTDRAPRRP